jgi:hypothetical protein
MKTLKHAPTLLWALVLALVAGCASVSVNKLDPRTGKLVEGAAEGVRYYLPRPYVSVFEPFIVSSEVYVAAGQLTPDGNYVLLTEVPKGLEDAVNDALKKKEQKMDALSIDASKVIARPALGAGPQNAPVTEGGEPAGESEEATAPPEGTGAPEDTGEAGGAGDGGTPQTGSESSGVLDYKVTNDNSTFAVTPQPRYFNILWLPDFDEQYVVTAKPGLGNSAVVINLGQGWSLQGVDAKLDNSAITKPLLDFWGGTLGALQKLATAKIEAPLALLGGGAPQAAPAPGESVKAQFGGGTRVTVKVTRVRIVAPGLYPILKPQEMKDAQLDEPGQKRILQPRPPFTNIAFNTYDALVIEAARSTGDAALRIHQYVDTTVPGSTPDAGGGGKTDGGTDTLGADLGAAQSKLRAELSKPENTTRQKEYYHADLTRAAAVTVTLRKRVGGTAGTLDRLPDAPAATELVVEFLRTLGIEAQPQNVVVN